MKKIALFALLLSCVPTEPEKDPKGGVAVTFAPSEATAGAPFPSRDGWAVQIEKVAIRATAMGVPQQLERGYGLGGHPRVFDPRYECELRVTRLPPGPAAVSVEMQAFDPRWGGDEIKEEDICAVDELTVRRFKQFSDDTLVTPDMLDPLPNSGSYKAGNTPTLYVKGTAQKNGRVLAFDWALAVETATPTPGEYDDSGVWHPRAAAEDAIVNIEVNKGVPAKFEVHVESLFARGIDELAAADTNGDGKVTPDELRAVKLACSSDYATGDYSSSSSSSGSPKPPPNQPWVTDDDDYAPYPVSGSSSSSDLCVTLLGQLVAQGSTVVAKIPTKR